VAIASTFIARNANSEALWRAAILLAASVILSGSLAAATICYALDFFVSSSWLPAVTICTALSECLVIVALATYMSFAVSRVAFKSQAKYKALQELTPPLVSEGQAPSRYSLYI
jgi:hypothetical protein